MRGTTNGALRAAVAVLSLAGTIIGISIAPAAASAAKAPIIIGYISDQTGAPASSYIGSEEGAQARIDAQNAAGGVDGRQLKLMAEDSTGTPQGNLTAAQLLVSEGAFGIIQDDSDAYGSSHYLNQQGIPVVGAAVDGPEWGQEPNTNMFAIGELSATTPVHGYFYTYNSTGEEFKDLGISKLAQVVFNVPSAIDAANTIATAAKSAGIDYCLDALLPSDGNLNPTVLQMKDLGCNGVYVLSVLATCVTLATDLKQADVKAKLLCATSYDQSLLDQPTALAAMQGTYTQAMLNVLNPTPPIKLFLDRLKKYTPWPGGIPNLNIDYSYFAADAMIKGLELAGSNPTRKAFISKLRKVSDYTVGGMLTTPIIFSHFGTVGMFPKKACGPILEIEGKNFVPVKTICGTLVRGAKA
jgi:branched-chain amino acid transport system substrate-binding protein